VLQKSPHENFSYLFLYKVTCGFSPVEQARQKFSVHFYLVGILFLVFDLEVLLIFPAAVSMYSLAQSGFWILLFFLVVLTIGFVYEYASGALNYANKEKDSELPPPVNFPKLENGPF
jgi:NADH:ubiquinone oxidoreductase subunit 3 (subunit A)